MTDEDKVLERTDGRIPNPPEWFKGAFGAAMVAGCTCAWLLQYLEWTDGLAAKRGWPVGKGAPVYGWDWSGQARRWLLSGGGYKGTYALTHAYGDGRPPATLGITDPLEALEAMWRREATT